ncbi:HxlR family transcriptional regulator [Chitinophaga skermanii]|uniref:HxlR family transcriptional regulator n=1 Tax=Chitinophaga skermanii TaxID=331697 RepID=A0A327QXU0_9BACT|nr:helix-turn-helix domain-containing protein [Chitinophaga skermanii]RAJ08795.1 HxlR family transcriptional regulator [Chitinophaga skermanii]
MQAKIQDVQPICAVDYAFRRIGGKYKGRLLWYLHNHQVLRYGELRRSIVDITPKMLTQTLRELEEDGLIHREVYHEVPPKVEYRLTTVGQELVPFIEHLRDWGMQQMRKENIPMIGDTNCITND